MDGGSAGDEFDPLDQLGQELREQVGEEMRQEAEMTERDAATVEFRRRRLPDVAIELLSRGDIVTVLAGARSVTGRLSYARGDIASIETPAGTVDVHLTAGVALRLETRSADGGVPPRPGSETLRARLFEHEIGGDRIQVWAPLHNLEVSGSIVAVGKDHVILSDPDEVEWVLGLTDIAWARAETGR